MPNTKSPLPFCRGRGRRWLAGLTAAGVGLCLWSVPAVSEAFCGFYVAGADAELYNDATVVVMMRDGKRTVLSMQNDYQGPPEDFAMVVPVPVVLSEDDVKTLPREIFDRVDKLAAPRLVEYWEQDPCAPMPEYERGRRVRASSGRGKGSMGSGAGYGVKVEAEFTVGEYEIVILSASDSTGLDSWLRDGGYRIPEGAEPLLRPYVQDGMKFFVAKVDIEKVKFTTLPNGERRATLSPLRFHYDSDEFALPVRLGLINAPSGEGKSQDLLVHILARNTRYQVANYPNVTIPTNLEVKDEVRERFGPFYVSLFDHTLAQNPKAVVTEYAWAANTCDPCPEPALTDAELATLGGDVIGPGGGQQGGPGMISWDFVLTRLHARYDKASLGEDLVFERAPAIVGGREFMQEDGQLERGARLAEYGGDNFQARYIIRHPWTGEIACDSPRRGMWGPKPDGSAGPKQPQVARKLATTTRGASLASFVTAESRDRLALAEPPAGDKAPEEPHLIGEDTGGPDAKQPPDEPGEPDKAEGGEAKAEAKPAASEGKGCGCATQTGGAAGGMLALLGGWLGLGLLRRRRRAAVEQG